MTTGLTTGPATADDEDPVTFTLGYTGDADSFNPFLGYQAISYEAWALEYDFLVGYKMTDMSPEPALAESWETSDDGLTWTFHMREGVTWNDGVPLTAADVAYTYNRVLTEKVAGGTWRSYIKTCHQCHRDRRHDRRDAAVDAQRDAAADADPDRPGAHLEGRLQGRAEALRERADGRQADRGVRPLHDGRGHGRWLDVQVREEPELLGRRARTSTRS